MRKNSIPVLVAGTVAFMAAATSQAQPYSNAVVALNPVAYWPLTETVGAPSGLYVATNSGALGAAGNGYYETWYAPMGGTVMLPTNVIQHAAGVTLDGDSALQCSMVGQYVIIPRTANGVANPALTIQPPFSVELWVYPTNTGGALKPLVSEGFINTLNGSSLGNQAVPQGFAVGSYNNIFYFALFNGAGTKTERDSSAFTANAWHHLVATFDGTTMVLYDNGKPSSGTVTARDALGRNYAPDLISPLLIGAGGSQNNPFGGIIDEVAIYTNVLSAQTVTNHFFAQTTNSPAGYYAATVQSGNPAIYLRLNEPAFTSAPDLSTMPVANNYGSLGAAANGRYQPGTTPGIAGPAYSGFGGASRAVALNGFNAGVDVGLGSVPAELNPTGNQPLTVMTWFQGNPADCIGRFQEIMGHSDLGWRLGLDFTAGNRFNPGNGPELLFNSVNYEIANGFFLNDGNWHFVAGVSDGTNDYLYLDGILARSGVNVGSIAGTNLDVLLGGDPQYTAPALGPGGGRYFDGNLAHAAFFTNALSAAQIQQVYSAAGVPPLVRVQPVSQAAFAGANVTLAPVVSGSSPLTYQWFKNGAPLGGQTGPALSFAPASGANNGSYYLAITNAYGWTTTAVAQVAVSTAAASAYAANIQSLGPAAYWPLDETIAPPFGAYIATNLGTAGASANGYYETWFQPVSSGITTTYYQTNSIQHVPGAIGDGDTAMTCNRNRGAGQYVIFPRSINGAPNPAVTLVPPFSVEFWAYPYTTLSNTVMPIVTEGRNPALDSSFASTNESGFSIGQYGSIFFFATWNNRGQDSTKQEIDVAVTSSNWQHFVVTFDGTNQTWFLNGTQAGTRAIPSSAANAAGQLYTVDMTSPLLIGNGSIPGGGNGASEWYGAVDEVAIYTNLLDPTSIQAHFAAAPATDSSYVNAVLASSPSIYVRLGEPAKTSYPSPATFPPAYNYGTVGGAANGAYQPGTTPGVAGPPYSGLGGSSRAVAINGFSGAVDVGGGSLPYPLNPTGNQPLTITAWMQGPADAPQRFQGIVSHGGSSWRLALDSTSAGLRFNPGAGPEVQFTNVTDVLISGAVVNDGNWHFVAGVSDGSTDSLYIDGVLARSSNGVSSIAGQFVDALIGGDPGNVVPSWNGSATSSPRYFAGNIAQVAFFTNALSAAQIQQIYSLAGVPPILTVQPPASVSTNAGQVVAISVAAKGSAPLIYQWYRTPAAAVAGQTTTALTFNPVVLANAGSYYVVVTNTYGAVTSSVVQLTVFSAPVVQQQSPTDVRVFVGTTPSLRISAIGPQPISYQWSRDGSPISGATTSSYQPGTGSVGTHTYICAITNSFGAATGVGAYTVAVLAAPTAPYPQSVLASAPLTYYRLNEPDNGLGNGNPGATAYDYAGALNATYTNTYLSQPGYDSLFSPQTEPAQTAALFGNFSSVNSFAGDVPTYLNFGATNGSPGTAFSVEAWVNGSGFQNAGLVTLGYGNGGEQFNLDTGANSHDFRFFVRDAAGSAHLANGTNSPSDGQWHHVVGVCDQPNGQVYLYVDGVQTAGGTIPTNSGLLALTVPLSIGSRQSGSGTPYDSQFQGTIDDVAIYGVALSPSQVQAHYVAAGVPVRIIVNPVSVTTNEGATVTMSIVAVGTTPLTYTWYDPSLNPIPGQTGPTLTLTNVQVSQSGFYYATVNNLYSPSPAQSTFAQLTVIGGPPVLEADLQPLFAMGYANRPFTYSVSVGGSAPFTYRWYRNGGLISGATNASYSFFTLTGTNYYSVIVSNAFGTAPSSVATNIGVAAPVLAPADYTFRMKITFAGYNHTEALANFPALVRLGTNVPGFSYGQFASAAGGDLRFTDATGTNQLPHEIDEWNPAGSSAVWVQVPRLASTNDAIWAYWGNPAATTPLAWSTNGEVWVPAFNSSPPFDVVYHLKESAFPFADSAQTYPALSGVAPTPAAGIVGTAGSFSGGQYLDAGVVTNLDDAFTLSAWLNIPPATSDIQTTWANQAGGFGQAGFALFVNSYQHSDQLIDLATGIGTGFPNTGGEAKTAAGAFGFGDWHLLTAAVNRINATVQFYVDGVAVPVVAGTVQAGFTNVADLNLGRFASGSFGFHGLMDEARIQSGAASADWVWANWMTVAQNSALENYSAIASSLVTLTFQVSGGNLILSWPTGTLQSASQVTGIYSDIPTATSPYPVPLTAGQQFYRVRVR